MRDLVLAAAVALALVCGCAANAEAVESVESGYPLEFIPLETGAACLDGTPFGFYFKKGSSTRWTINIQGGGWCYNETLCYSRSLTALGSSKFFPTSASCGCMFFDESGNPEDDCNCAFLPYCDGASFSGYRAKPFPAGNGKNITFRGLLNLDATLDTLFSKYSFGDATELVVTGGSAGGLSTFLHTDRVAARMPKGTKVRGAPVVGYFLDHNNYVHDSNNYTAWMQYIYTMQNLTTGGLMATCLQKYSQEPYKCFMAPYAQAFVTTPFFMLNSKYDQWQLDNILQVPCIMKQTTCSDAERSAILQYGDSFMSQLAPVQAESQNGAFITSCICHGCPWTDNKQMTISNLTAYQAFSRWYTDPTHAQRILIDPRTPNGNDTITDSGCVKW